MESILGGQGRDEQCQQRTCGRVSLGPWAQEQLGEHPAWSSVGESHLDSGFCDLPCGLCWAVNHMFVLRLYLFSALLSLPHLNNFLRTASSLRAQAGS